MQLGPMAGVLLVVSPCLMLGLPPRTHTLVIDLPPSYYPQVYWEEELPHVIHAITLDAEGQLRWNGEPVTPSDLLHHLNDTWEEPETPSITFELAADTNYANVVATLNLIQGSGIGSNHFCLKGIAQ
jgi:biopolymer transport protein ExbD